LLAFDSDGGLAASAVADRPEHVGVGLAPALPAGGFKEVPPALVAGPADAVPGAAVDEAAAHVRKMAREAGIQPDERYQERAQRLRKAQPE
jgi:hypothetical protein